MSRRPRAQACFVASQCPPDEAEIYTKFRDVVLGAHCGDKRPSHKCCGKIILERSTITLSCPLCGDCRQLVETNTGKKP